MTVVYTGPDLRLEQERRQNNETRVLDALRAAGKAGRTNYELVAIGGLRAVGGRVDALRAKGYDVESIREGGGVWRFILHEPARVRPGMQGYLASLEPVASVEPARTDLLF